MTRARPPARWTHDPSSPQSPESRAGALFSAVGEVPPLAHAIRARHLAALRQSGGRVGRRGNHAAGARLLAIGLVFGGPVAFAAAGVDLPEVITAVFRVIIHSTPEPPVARPAPRRVPREAAEAERAVLPDGLAGIDLELERAVLPDGLAEIDLELERAALPEGVAEIDQGLPRPEVTLERARIQLEDRPTTGTAGPPAPPAKPRMIASAVHAAASANASEDEATPADEPTAHAEPTSHGDPTVHDEATSADEALSADESLFDDEATPPAQAGLPDTRHLPPAQRIALLVEAGEPELAAQLLRDLETSGGLRATEREVLHGRIDTGRGECRRAIGHFTAALNADGPADLAQEALYRRAVCNALLGDALSSHADIDLYLLRYPDGPYVGVLSHRYRR